MLGAHRGDPDLRRVQPDLLPAVHPGLSRDAAALPRLPAGVPGSGTCMSSAGASILAVGYLLPLFYLRGRCSGASGPAPTRGPPPGWSGGPRRPRPSTTSTRRRPSPARPTSTTRNRSRRMPEVMPETGPGSAGTPIRHHGAAGRSRRVRHVGLPRDGGAVLRRHAVLLRGLSRNASRKASPRPAAIPRS